jgi:dTDP-4-dehydrorhamnose 3,5-epimerase
VTEGRPTARGIRVAAAAAVATAVLSAAPRILLAAGALPDALRPFVWSDVLLTYVDRLAGGRIPYFETFFEYPPLIGYLSGAFVRLAPGAVLHVALWALVSALAAGAVGLVLARAVGSARAVVFWSLSPQLLLYGGMNFDAFAIAFLAWALTLSRRGRPRASLTALALGTCAKVFPAILAPLELTRMWRGRGTRAAVAGAMTFVALVLLVALPSLVAPYPITRSAAYVAGLANFDSAWGLVLAAMRAAGAPSPEAVIAALSTLGMLATYGYVLMRRSSDDPARAALLGLIAVLLWSRLYSPQYSLWVVPLFALAAVPARTLALLSAADALVFLTVYPLTLGTWPEGDPRATVLFGALAAGIVLRHLALIVAWRQALWWHPVAVIPGVERRTLVPHADARGTLREIWRRSRQALEVRQVLVSSSAAGALRGMHYHLRQSDLCYVDPGRVYMALVDLRATEPVTEEFWLTSGETLLIPPGVAHGYATAEAATVSYLLTEESDGSDEFGFRFDDPAAGIHWPIERPTISARDRDAGTFAAAHAAVRTHLG